MRAEAVTQILFDESFARVAPPEDNVFFEAGRDDINNGWFLHEALR